MKLLDELIQLIDGAIDDNADNLLTGGNIIASGYNLKIDEYRDILHKGHEWISEYKQNLIQVTSIKTLRIKYTNNSGYFIEVPKNQVGNIPDFFIHKQTLVSAQRYTTIELQKFQSDIDVASSTLYDLEYAIFLDIRNNVLSYFNDLYSLSRSVEVLDFYSNAAYVSKKNNYITPEMVHGYKLNINSGRHPVMESVVGDFISNNISLDRKQFVNIITGPNMGGKSTFLRQNALLILLAHIGFDIPAKDAQIPITDKIFSRVGSGDNLFLGQSTFMVEMQEIAYILRNSTEKSFVIIDEIGRGTSTYDGMSLAWSILKYNHDKIKAKTLFATHYHEIIDYSDELSGAKNFSVAVGENDESIVFLRKIIPGGIKKSYGIEVARLAGIPEEVLKFANHTLTELKTENSFQQLSFGVENDGSKEKIEDSNISLKYEGIISDFEKININNITPIEALILLQSFQEQVKKKK